MEKGTVKDALGKAKAVSSHAASKVATKAVDAAMAAKSTVTSATDKISSEIASRKEAKAVSQQDQYDNGMKEIKDTEAEAFLTALGKSPISLTAKQVEKIQKTFPIPKEQIILWADAEFDLRPSGIICTQKGVFIRSNIDFFGKKKQDRDGKSILYYYRWDNFDPGRFVGEEKEDNVALTVEEPCSQQFVQTCRSFTAEEKKVESQGEEVFVNPHKQANDTVKASFTVWVGNHQNQDAIFAEQKANRNNKAGHGEMAEEANTILDRLHGKNAKTVGRDNRKNGPDRRIGKDLFIQSKYYKTARGSLESAFDSGTGLYRYMQNGKPMQLEVPKDQYQQVLKGFEQKIRDHKVPGVTDPAQASQFVRKGRLTYQQAVNLTKPGTIESLAYDAITGVVTCSCAFGLTFVVTTFLTWRETRDMKQAALAGISAGGQVFGISFVQHVLISQLSRTRLADILLKPSQFVVNKLGTHTTANLVNGIRALSGKGAIYGAAAASNLAKILRGNALTSAISYAAFSIPATYRLMSKKYLPLNIQKILQCWRVLWLVELLVR